MRLKTLEIRNFRSLFADAENQAFKLELGTCMNVLVGPNNCGKSNVFRALAVALDPTYRFDRSTDMPANWPFAKPVVTLTFEVDSSQNVERHLS